MTNQFEYHPYLNQELLIDECRRLGVAVTAYCGMAVGRVFGEPILKDIASVHRKTVAQVVLRWLVQQEGVVALSRTTDPARVTGNLQVFDFELSAAEMAAIHGLAQADSRIVNPPGLAPAWDATAPSHTLPTPPPRHERQWEAPTLMGSHPIGENLKINLPHRSGVMEKIGFLSR